MLRAGRTLTAHLVLLQPWRLGGSPDLLALCLRFGGCAFPLWRRTLGSSGRLRGSLGQQLFLCRHRGLLLHWSRARGLALLGGAKTLCGRGLPFWGCRRLSGRWRGCSLLLAGSWWPVLRGAAGRLLWGRQRHRGRVAEAAFKQPLGLAVQAQPFILLKKQRKEKFSSNCGASPQQGPHQEAPLVGDVMVQRTQPTQSKQLALERPSREQASTRTPARAAEGQYPTNQIEETNHPVSTCPYPSPDLSDVQPEGPQLQHRDFMFCPMTTQHHQLFSPPVLPVFGFYVKLNSEGRLLL